jgi:hypothetical protein
MGRLAMLNREFLFHRRIVCAALFAVMVLIAVQPAAAQDTIGVYYEAGGSTASTCSLQNILGTFSVVTNIPNDGRSYEQTITRTADDGTNSGGNTTGPDPLAPGQSTTNLNQVAVPATSPGDLDTDFTYTRTIRTFADGQLVLTSTLTIFCNHQGGTDWDATVQSISTQASGAAGALSAFSGPGLPLERDLVLFLEDTPVLIEPRSTTSTGESILQCQTAFVIDYSDDELYGEVFVMGGWVPMAATVLVADNYGQPGGQPIWLGCEGR